MKRFIVTDIQGREFLVKANNFTAYEKWVYFYDDERKNVISGIWRCDAIESVFEELVEF